MTSPAATNLSEQTIELSPSYRLPITLLLVGIPLGLIKVWVGFAIALLGVFLLFQAATIRLRFTPTDLDLYRGERLLRRFPYANWQNWQIFWSPIPILFYFKEINSIHFLPILFDPKTLQACLETRISPIINLR